MSYLDRCEGTTRGGERADDLTATNVRGPHIISPEVGDEDDSVKGEVVKGDEDEEVPVMLDNEVTPRGDRDTTVMIEGIDSVRGAQECVTNQPDRRPDNVTMVTPDMRDDDDIAGGGKRHQGPQLIGDITTGVDYMIINDTVYMVTDYVRGTQVDFPVDGTVVPGDERVSKDLVPLTPHQQTLHPLMVSGSEDGDQDRPNVVCTYTESVCDIHGPATEKWRGHNVWGKKKNGLYG